ncbi:hypothetical protein [Methylorubrum rhodinum]|uniref:hypothetical protein n=1 Tax=Methylorubrum rhodinum TaxID=29428 RepID=UPI0035E4112B
MGSVRTVLPGDGGGVSRIGRDVFVHIVCVEKAGLRDLADGRKIAYEDVIDRCRGTASADNLKVDETIVRAGSQGCGRHARTT